MGMRVKFPCDKRMRKWTSQYAALYNFLQNHKYQSNYTKVEKRGLRQNASSYKLDCGKLMYYHKASMSWKQVPRDEVCNSLSRTISESYAKQVASILCHAGATITIVSPNVQKQKGSTIRTCICYISVQ